MIDLTMNAEQREKVMTREEKLNSIIIAYAFDEEIHNYIETNLKGFINIMKDITEDSQGWEEIPIKMIELYPLWIDLVYNEIINYY